MQNMFYTLDIEDGVFFFNLISGLTFLNSGINIDLVMV